MLQEDLLGAKYNYILSFIVFGEIYLNYAEAMFECNEDVCRGILTELERE